MMKSTVRSIYLFCVLLLIGVVGCGNGASDEGNGNGETDTTLESAVLVDGEVVIPELTAYQQKVQDALASPFSVMLLGDVLTENEETLAQTLALQTQQFMQYTRDQQSGQPYRNEIMSVRPLLAGDYTDQTAVCADTTCYRIEMYNFFLNLTSVAVIDVVNRRPLAVNHFNDAQPDLNQRLIDLAKAIANNAPEVKDALGDRLNTSEPVMSEIKTALNGSRCERSRHLCVAPTYIVDDQALWAIVDLTDGKLVGTRWTNLGESSVEDPITQQAIEYEHVMLNYCEKSNTLKQGDWEMSYLITSSDGMAISDVRFAGKRVMTSAKLVDWHVSYSERDGFGYSDAIGCPLFSSAVVVAYTDPQIEEIVEDGETVGFAFIQDFRQQPWPVACNYRYEQRFEFYNDGRFRVAAANYGRGCGTDGTYRPVMRIDLDASTDGTDSFAEWDGSAWQTWDVEQWQLQTDDTAYTAEGYQYRVSAADGSGYYIEPGQGQFGDGGRGDNAYTYVSVHHPDRDEGDTDLITIGSCCNTDYQQGPEKFIDPAEPIDGSDLVLWYVPQQNNNNGNENEDKYCWANGVVKDGIVGIDVWPCFTGPMFVPIQP